MGLEAATFIDSLNATWPLGSDKIREGDDHLRLLKQVLKNTFPQANAAQTATPDQINSLGDLTGLIADIITELQLHIHKKGSIIMWDLANNAVLPTGWYLCNGQTVSGYGVVPDMRDKFIVGGGNLYSNQSTGGSLNTSSDGAVDLTVQPHTLTIAEIPAHTHTLNNVLSYPGSGPEQNQAGGVEDRSSVITDTGSAGGGGSHDHAINDVPAHTHTILPTYYAAVFIIKCTNYVDP